MSNESKRCKVHYTGTFNDGTKFDSSYDRGEPLEFVCGAGMMIKGFDEAVKNMNIGEIVDVHLMLEEAYGMPDPANIITVAFEDMPGSENLEIVGTGSVTCFTLSTAMTERCLPRSPKSWSFQKRILTAVL